MNNILVTGTSGFIGHNLYNAYMLQNRYNVYAPTSKELNILHKEQVKNFFKNNNIDVVIHLAGISKVKWEEEYYYDKIIDINITGTMNLLEYCNKGTKFVLASSGTVYGPATFLDLPFTEKQPTAPQSIYATTKLAGEGLLKSYTKLRDIVGVTARMNANVGPFATHGIVMDFVRKLRSESKTLDVLGDYPGSRKPITNVNDTCSALMLLAEKTPNSMYEIFNIAVNDSIFVNQVADAVMDAMNIHKPTKWLGKNSTWIGDDNYVTINSDKIRKYGWTPKFDCSKDAIYHGVLELIKYG